MEKSQQPNLEAGRIIEYIKNHKMDLQNAKASLFAADLVFRSYSESKKIHGVDFSPVLAYFNEGTDFYQITSWDNITAVAKRIYSDYLADPQTLEEKIASHQRISQDIDKIWSEYQSNRHLSNEELLKIYNSLISRARDWWGYGVIGEDKGRIIDEEIVPLLAQNLQISKSEASNLVSILSHPEVASPLSRERKDFFKLCLYALDHQERPLEKDQDFLKLFGQYAKEYFYRHTDFYTCRLVTLESVIAEIKEEIAGHTAESIKQELLDLDQSFNCLTEQKLEMRKKFQLTDEYQKKIDFATKTVAWIDWRKAEMMKQFFYVLSLLQEVAGRSNLSYRQISLMTTDEVRTILSDNKLPSSAVIEKRKKSFIAVFESGKPIQLFFGQNALTMFTLAKGSGKGEQDLSGAVASLGSRGDKIIRGKVRLVIDPLKDKFESGEILVTSMTRIEFVPLMKKALAIITNEGGIACHAAIVSRELGVPCVIGTRRATDVLKSGDMVEIDVAKGLIRII